MNPVDRTLRSLPFARAMLADTTMQDVNSKWDMFNASNITKDKQLQRLSIVNQFDHQMEHTTNGGRIPNMFYHTYDTKLAPRLEYNFNLIYNKLSQYTETINSILDELD